MEQMEKTCVECWANMAFCSCDVDTLLALPYLGSSCIEVRGLQLRHKYVRIKPLKRQPEALMCKKMLWSVLFSNRISIQWTPQRMKKIIDMMLFRNKKAIGKYYHKNMSGIYLI